VRARHILRLRLPSLRGRTRGRGTRGRAEAAATEEEEGGGGGGREDKKRRPKRGRFDILYITKNLGAHNET
jgi:hypothetical protein